MSVTAETRSLTEELTDFVYRVLATEKDVSVEKMIRLAHDHFDGDRWMKDALVREGLNAMVPRIAGDVKHALRTRAREATSSDEIRRERIRSVFEHVGGGHSKSIIHMNRPNLIFAAEERETAAAGHMRWATLFRSYAGLLKNDVDTVGDLPPAEVTRLWQDVIERN